MPTVSDLCAEEGVMSGPRRRSAVDDVSRSARRRASRTTGASDA